MIPQDRQLMEQAISGENPAFATVKVTLEIPVSVVNAAKDQARRMKAERDPGAVDWKTLLARATGAAHGVEEHKQVRTQAQAVKATFDEGRAIPWGLDENEVEELDLYRRFVARSVKLLRLLGFEDGAREVEKKGREAAEGPAEDRAYEKVHPRSR